MLINIIVLILTFSSHSKIALAFGTNVITGKVVEIIDGDSIKILSTNGETKFVKLLCVDTQGYNLAFDYMNNEIMGKDVVLSFDIRYPSGYNIWNYAYVYSNGMLVNQTLLEKGYGKVNDIFNSASKYKSMVVSSAFAQKRKLGIWKDDESVPYTSDHNYRDYYININTADKYTLNKYLIGVSNELAEKIVRHRRRYDFDLISDILKVDGMTTDVYYDNIYIMITETNINEATYEELLSLGSLTSRDVDKIIAYQKDNTFSSIYDLYRKGLITKSKFDEIEKFIYV